VPDLLVLSDPIKCERSLHPLRVGETLAHALMRLWPEGFEGSWRIYRDCVDEDNELAAVDLPYIAVLASDHYLLVRDMAGPAVAGAGFAAMMESFAISLAFSLAMQVFTPKPPRHRPDDPERISPNNQIAGQGNALRPGARVPDLLGTVRAYPDLLCMPVDVYNETSQTIGQMFVLGMGSYDVPEDGKKLGETPIPRLLSADLDVFQPGEEVPPFFVLKISREVGDVPLLAEQVDVVPISGEVDFAAGPKTMTTLVPLPLGVGRPITISGGTFFNNAAFWVNAVPPDSQTAPPFVYTLEGPVVDELGANPLISQALDAMQLSRDFWYGNAAPLTWPSTSPPVPPKEQQVQFAYGWPGKDQIPKVGQLIELTTNNGHRFRGRIAQTRYPLGNRPSYWGLVIRDLYGIPIVFPSMRDRPTIYRTWDEQSAGGSTAPAPGTESNAPSNWYSVPMLDAPEIWIDIAFPSGLAFYDSGARRSMEVIVNAEIRRQGDSVVRTVSFSFFYGTTTPMRFTKRIDVRALALPAGSSVIEVRVQRVTPFKADTSSKQYLQDTRWVRLAGARSLVGQRYPKCTVMAFSMSNTRSVGAVGDMALNVVATRILPTYDGSGGMTGAVAPTNKWADNFVARCMATDGAHRSLGQLDLAGIYQLQEQLDRIDGGRGGEISLTLDQVQDIDAELAQIADVARAVVYRVGRKLFVARDQANTTAIALFNARTKAPSGETMAVRMTADADNDCVVVTWMDSEMAWKQRDYRYPEDAAALNPLRVAAVCANWEQARRRALFEWNKLKYRRKQLTLSVTEDGRICRPGDVINVTDDTATLATCAGEVISIAGAVLTLDRDLVLGDGITFVILLRDVAGQRVDLVPCAPAVGVANQVTLSRSPGVTIKGRDASMGTMFAFYSSDAANVQPWLVLGLETAGPYVNLTATNYTPKVYEGDFSPTPLRPPPPNLS